MTSQCPQKAVQHGDSKRQVGCCQSNKVKCSSGITRRVKYCCTATAFLWLNEPMWQMGFESCSLQTQTICYPYFSSCFTALWLCLMMGLLWSWKTLFFLFVLLADRPSEIMTHCFLLLPLFLTVPFFLNSPELVEPPEALCPNRRCLPLYLSFQACLKVFITLLLWPLWFFLKPFLQTWSWHCEALWIQMWQFWCDDILLTLIYF